MATLSERLRQKKQTGSSESGEKAKGLRASNLAIPAVDAGIKSLNRSSIVNEKLLEIDPQQCRPWQHHNRHSGWLEKQKLSSLVDSIRQDGQLQPGLVRKTKDENFPYEIIFGVRRWSACKALGRKFRARITQEDDKSCIRLMHFENEESKNISPLEKAFAFSDQLDSGLYETQAEFAQEMNMTVRHLSRLLRIAKLREHEKLTTLLFKFVDELSLRGVEEVAGFASQMGSELDSIVDRIDLLCVSEGGLSFADVVKKMKSLSNAEKKTPVQETRVYLKHGRKSLVQATRKNREVRIVLKEGIDQSDDLESILVKIAQDLRSGSL